MSIFNYTSSVKFILTMNDKHKLFKERLLDELSYQGFSKTDFAERVGISINTLNMYLYRGSIPAADVAVKMAQVLNTTTEYLILGTTNNKSSSKQGAKADWQTNEIKIILERLPPEKLESFLEIARAYKKAVCED